MKHTIVFVCEEKASGWRLKPFLVYRYFVFWKWGRPAFDEICEMPNRMRRISVPSLIIW